MSILPINQYKINRIPSFKSTRYEERRVIEEDAFNRAGRVKIYENLRSMEPKNIFGVELYNNDNRTSLFSKNGQLIASCQKKSKDLPKFNLHVGAFHPIIEIVDKELGIVMFVTKGTEIKGKSFDLDYPMLSKHVAFGHNLVITTGKNPDNTEKVVKEYLAYDKGANVKVNEESVKKHKKKYTIVALGGDIGDGLSPLSDLLKVEDSSVLYQGGRKKLIEVAGLDTAYRAGKIDKVDFIRNDDTENVINPAGLIIKGIKDGTIDINKPLVLLPSGLCNNIDLARALYEHEKADDSGISMLVTKVDDIDGKTLVRFGYNKEKNSHKIIDYSPIVSDENRKLIEEEYQITNTKNGEKAYYAATNTVIISPTILAYFADFANKDGSADYQEFCKVMNRVLNYRTTKLKESFPEGIKNSKMLPLYFADQNGYPQKIVNKKRRQLFSRAIIAKDIQGRDAQSEEIKTIDDYIDTAKKIGAFSNFDNLFKAAAHSPDGTVYTSSAAKERFELFKEKYGINNIKGNIVVHVEQRPLGTMNLAPEKQEKAESNDITPESFYSSNSTLGMEDVDQRGVDPEIKVLFNSMKNGLVAQTYIKSLMEHPEKLQGLAKKMIKQFGLSRFLEWYLSPKGYYGQYEKYVKDYVDNAKSIDDLLKLSPNWEPWRLEIKALKLSDPRYAKLSDEEFSQLVEKMGIENREFNFTIGELPDPFKTEKDIAKFANDVKTWNYRSGYLKGWEYNRINTTMHKDRLVYYACDKVEDPDYELVIKVDSTNPEDIKMADDYPMDVYTKKMIRRRRHLSPGSLYSSVCMNRYLELNGCKNVPVLIYYNYKENLAIYQNINNDKPLKEDLSLLELNNKFKSLNKLGVYLSDVEKSSYRECRVRGENVIDLAHAVFAMPFKPSVRDMNVDFSSGWGPDLRSVVASFFLE